MSDTNVIVIPGLGGKYHLYKRATRHWQRHGMNPVVFPINWEDTESYTSKARRLNHVIERLSQDNKPLIIVGISAGASAALNAFAQHNTITKVVLICGFMNISFMNQQLMTKRSRAFVDSVRALQSVLPKLSSEQKEHILSLTSYNDMVVTDEAAHINGVAHQKIRASGHIFGIAVALLFYAKTIKKYAAE
jgi:pimeloyl-ACP methyl ester carboxylesterase